MSASAALSIVVPTFGRESILIETLRRLRALEPPADEILVIDQSTDHEKITARELERMAADGSILWRKREEASIPGAMNQGLREACGARLIFVDDDVDPDAFLVGAHLDAAERHGKTVIVAGQVLQPGQAPSPVSGGEFRFNSTAEQEIDSVMGGNFSVDRELAVGVGGFDENFVGAAYHFEADFCLRARTAGARIWFEPKASLRHLRAARGGTRSFGSHLATAGPLHAVGEYYFLLSHRQASWRRHVFSRLARSWMTRFHLAHPWRIPVTLLAELRGLALARSLARRGPRLLSSAPGTSA